MQGPLFDNTQYSPVGFEPAILASEWPQAHGLDRVVLMDTKQTAQFSRALIGYTY